MLRELVREREDGVLDDKDNLLMDEAYVEHKTLPPTNSSIKTMISKVWYLHYVLPDTFDIAYGNT